MILLLIKILMHPWIPLIVFYGMLLSFLIYDIVTPDRSVKWSVYAMPFLSITLMTFFSITLY